MIKRFAIFSFLVFFSVSCEIQEETPDNILSEEKMASILVDTQLLEATYNSRLLNLLDRKERMTRYYNEIFEHHGVTEESFNESYTYYEEHPEKLDLIYEMVFEDLERLLTEEETKSENQKKKSKEKDKSEKK
jgi:hypothetical protein